MKRRLLPARNPGAPSQLYERVSTDSLVTWGKVRAVGRMSMARHKAALNPSCRRLLAIRAFLKLPAQAQTRCVVGANLTLPLDIAPPLCRSIKNVVGRLNEASRFKFSQ